MSYENRKNWDEIYDNQDKILNILRNTQDIFLAGGTAIQRFLINKPYRESDDLDFFISIYDDNLANTAFTKIVQSLRDSNDITIENIMHEKGLGVKRVFCSVKNSDEMIKVELLNCTTDRYNNLSYVECNNFPRVENAYNMILYKLKALSDRKDTIKDLFDLYFLCREFPHQVKSIKDLMFDLELKFLQSTGYKYDLGTTIKAFKVRSRNWDIVLSDQVYKDFYIQEAIESFRKEFLEALTVYDDNVDFSYQSKVDKITNQEVPLDAYYEFIETNLFIAEHALSLGKFDEVKYK